MLGLDVKNWLMCMGFVTGLTDMILGIWSVKYPKCILSSIARSYFVLKQLGGRKCGQAV